MNKLVTTNHKLTQLQELEQSFQPNSNTLYYMYAADIPNNSDIKETVRDYHIKQYQNMIFGKRLYPNNVNLVVRNIPYELNKVYTKYDDIDDVNNKDFYTIVQENEFFHVYKVLDNNNNSPSLVPPQISYVAGSNNHIFKTLADGYVWKYMTSVNELDVNFFDTEYYFPIKANSEVKSGATSGSIDVFAIDGEGRGYDNYLHGTFRFDDLSINQDPLLYRVANDHISHANGYYTGCIIYISEGEGIGHYKTITDYFSNSNGNFIVIESPFEVTPVNGSKYEIYPEVIVNGTGINLDVSRARAVINSLASNSVSTVEVLNKGLNYETANATVIANSIVGVLANAVVRPIMPPKNGHGFDVFSELYAKTLVISNKFEGDEQGAILSDNDYNTIGILKSPLFANVSIKFDTFNGSFNFGEKVHFINPLLLSEGVVVSTTSSEISKETLYLSNITLVNQGSSGSYLPGEILAINSTGGISIEDATVFVSKVEVRTAEVNAGGANYTNNDVVWLDTGTGTKAEFIVETDGDGEVVSIAPQNSGLYTVAPDLDNGVTDTEGSGSGLTINVTTRIAEALIQHPGAYREIPENIVDNAVIGGSGSGAQFALTFEQSLPGHFLNQFKPGQHLYLSNKEGTQHQLAYVSSVSNNSSLQLNTEGFFSCTESLVYIANCYSTAIISNVISTSELNISNLNIPFDTGSVLVGEQRGGMGVVDTFSRNGIEKTFDTFIQLYKYDIEIVSGNFEKNERIFQENSESYATFYIVRTEDSKTMLYVKDLNGDFSLNKNIIGLDSGTIATITEKYNPELIFGSGDILFVENIDPITRVSNQTEIFKVVFDQN